MATPPPRPAVPAALVTLSIHVAVWGAFVSWVTWVVPLGKTAIQNLQMKMPWATEVTMQWSAWFTDLLPLTLATAVVFLIADLWLLIRLGRPGRYAIRELWSGLVI